ncbi:MAG: SH3 domain-containing protein, partial [Gammaproteobacteria bacterium]|nr:SH3 domain-containing protein [Gammaproteobacteria bacterium]
YALISKETANQRLMTVQQQNQFVQNFFHHFFSPWQPVSKNTIQAFKKDELRSIHFYENNPGWGENFHQHHADWVKKIVQNMNMSTFPNTDRYAITVNNTYVRQLPTIEPHFFNFRKAGEGYPFDNLQETSLWAGTPLHVLQMSWHGDWLFIQSPEVTGWVQMKDVAFVDQAFIHLWEKKKFVATVVNQTAVKDSANIYRFTAYMGSLFPVDKIKKHRYRIFIPVANLNDEVQIRTSEVTDHDMQLMPISPTPMHFANLINQLLGTPYGWGGMYFYNDCSGTLKSLFTPIGIWLPRNSGAQAKVAPHITLNTLSSSEQEELLDQSKPFLTLIYLPGHIILYVGKRNGKYITFQNLWAFITKNEDGSEGRAVVGKAALMNYYPYTNITYQLIRLVN